MMARKRDQNCGTRESIVSVLLVALLVASAGTAQTGPVAGSGSAGESDTSEPAHGSVVNASSQEDPVSRAARTAEQTRQRSRNVARDLVSATSMVDRLSESANVSPSSLPPQSSPSFTDAVSRFYDAADVQAPPAPRAPSARLGTALAPAIADLATAIELAREATPQDTEVPAPASPADLENRSVEVDMDKMVKAGLYAARAQDTLDALDVDDDAWPSLSTPTSHGSANNPATCNGTGGVLIGPLIEIGTTANDFYATPRVLIVDPGGNDCYQNKPASATPYSALPVPVSIIAELGGNDFYLANAPYTPPGGITAGAGVGLFGVGLLMDRWGDDHYNVTLRNSRRFCENLPDDIRLGRSLQAVLAEGTGVSGVGALVDLDGNDVYEARNVHTELLDCHWVEVHTFAQGTGVYGGVGLLGDDTGDDDYVANATAAGSPDNLAFVGAQGAATGGTGHLVDKEGHDVYNASSHAFMADFERNKGVFAYTDAQGAIAATDRPIDLIPMDPGTPFVGPCVMPETDEACSAASTGILVDVLGQDRFNATARSNENGKGCTSASWAVVTSQGSAGWNGFALLASFDVQGSDEFTIHANATGSSCGTLGTRAETYGQGYGGTLLHEPRHTPDSDAIPNFVLPECLFVDDANGDPAAGTCLRGVRQNVGVLLNDGALDGACLPMVSNPGDGVLCDHPLTGAPDTYHASANATDVDPDSTDDNVAETWAQGVARRRHPPPNPGWRGGETFSAHGYGVLLDWEGDDHYHAVSETLGDGVEFARTRAQAMSNQSTALHADVGGDDIYRAQAYVDTTPWHQWWKATGGGSTGPVRANVSAQAYSQAGGIIPPFPTCTPPGLPVGACVWARYPVGEAVLLDVGGNDTYSEAAVPPPTRPSPDCQGNNPSPFPVRTWGSVNTPPPSMGGPDPACAGPGVTGTGTPLGIDAVSTVNI